jgi:hypothetical protein
VATNYPGALDSLTNPTVSSYEDDAGVFHDEQHANANDAIEAIEAELGTDPAGAQATVKARLEYVEQHKAQFPLWESGRYILNARGYVAAGTINCAQDEMNVYPWWCPRSVTLDRVAVEVTTLQSGANARLGLYSVGASGVPGSLVVDFGEINCSSTGVKELTVSQAVTAGPYYLTLLNEVNGVSYRSLGTSAGWAFYNKNDTGWSTNYLVMNATRTYTSGFPATHPGTSAGGTSAPPLFWMRRT